MARTTRSSSNAARDAHVLRSSLGQAVYQRSSSDTPFPVQDASASLAAFHGYIPAYEAELETPQPDELARQRLLALFPNVSIFKQGSDINS
jgi:hypothetical protein